MHWAIVLSLSLILLQLEPEYVWSIECKFGREEIDTQRVATTQVGQYVDLDHPLTCSGYIVKWHLCYYTSNVQDTTDHQVYLRVYRNESSRELLKIHQVMLEYELDSTEVEADTFICINKSLEVEEYLSVETGDYLAVYLPTLSRPLLVVGFSSPQLMLYRDTRRFPDPFIRDTVPFSQLNGLAGGFLHLHADVVPQSVLGPISSSIPQVSKTTLDTISSSSTTVRKVLTSTPTVDPSQPSGKNTSSDDDDDSQGISTWKIAIVVTFATILLALILAILVVAIVVYRRWKVKQMKKTLLEIRPSHMAIDNATYDLVDSYRLFKRSKRSKGSGGHKGISGRSRRAPSTTSENLYESPYDEGITEVFSIYASLAPSSEEFRSSVKKVVTSLNMVKPTPYQTPATHEEQVYEQISGQQVPSLSAKHIKIIGQIGSGQFANVEKALWSRASGMIEVAVKTLHSDASSTDKLKFLQEGAITSQFRHPNVVFLHGIITDKSKVSLVMEYMSKGDMKGCLMNIRTEQADNRDIPLLLLSYSTQVAMGMLYLSDKGFIHRDLAARNILVSDKDVCKIADFGMSRDLADAEYYISEGGTIPIRWTAPEAVYYRKYSTASDVWSYGCVLYEIWSLGHKPFENCSNTQVLKEISIGFRLPPPPGCPLRAYDIMIKCWHPHHSKRPGFNEALRYFLDNEKSVLNIPSEDATTHEKATCLGAELQAGHMMYRNLQALYIPANVSISDRPPCDGANLIKYTSDRRREGDYEDVETDDDPPYLNVTSKHHRTPFNAEDEGYSTNIVREERPASAQDDIYDSIKEERHNTGNSSIRQREEYYNVMKITPQTEYENTTTHTRAGIDSTSPDSDRSPSPPPLGSKPAPARVEEKSTTSLHDMVDGDYYESAAGIFTSNNDEVIV